MSAREYFEIRAMYNLQPWGEERADLRAGIVAAVVANVNRAEDQKPYHPLDFTPKFGEVQQETVADKAARIRRLHEEIRQEAERKRTQELDPNGQDRPHGARPDEGGPRRTVGGRKP